jgi:hypothetical protein
MGYGSELPVNYGYFDTVRSMINDIDSEYALLDFYPPIIKVSIWESVTRDVDSIWMDSTVANEYHVPIRRFILDSIRYVTDTNTVRVTPDITRKETQMYFYYIATRYIRAGVENINFGELNLENLNDSGNLCAWDLYTRIRKFAANYNRGLVLLDGENYGLDVNGQFTLLYDYFSAPTRVSGYYTGKDSTWTSMCRAWSTARSR